MSGGSGVSSRVAERYLLAARVATRIKNGDSMGDPKELLARYKKDLVTYGGMESEANEWLRLNADVLKANAHYQATGTPEAAVALKTLRIQRDGGGVGTGTYTDNGSVIARHLMRHGFDALQLTARDLCLSLLQQSVLPPKLRKSIEVASKFWMRSVRTSPRGKNVEETTLKRVELYMEHLGAFKKYERLFEDCVREGKPHSDSGEVVTRYKSGPFVVVNTGGFDTTLMTNKVQLCGEAAQKMEAIGLGKVCYGDVLITNRLSGENTQAFYLPSKDEMFIRADAKVTLDTVRVVCHELTHRLEDKFLVSKKSEIVALFRTIERHSNEGVVFPKIGEPVKYKDKDFKVTDYDIRRKSVQIKENLKERVCFICGKTAAEHVPDAEHKTPIFRDEAYSMPLATYYHLQGKKVEKKPLDFITPYAKRGGPSENFAEMVSFYAIGQLPKEQVELLLPLL